LRPYLADPAPALFIGDIAIDEYFSAPRWPNPGDKAELKTLASYVGGSIANAARVHAKLGGHTEFISLLNRGEFTPRILHDLDSASVSHTYMLFSDDAADQRNLIFLVDGEHIVFTPDSDELPMVLAEDDLRALSRPGFVYTTLQRAQRLRAEGKNANETVTHLRQHGRKFIFDLDVVGAQLDSSELLKGAHLVMMNDRGFEHTFGGSSRPALQKVTDWLRQFQIGALLHTRAAAGATLYTAESTTDISGHRVSVVDVTGAGDTLGGALTWALGSGYSMEHAVEFGIAAASRSVMYMGPQGGVATKEEIDQFKSAN
jgi:sugar/nucleoside kinase (ribokinase family)